MANNINIIIIIRICMDLGDRQKFIKIYFL